MSFDYIEDMQNLKDMASGIVCIDKHNRKTLDYIIIELCDSIIVLNNKVKELENGLRLKSEGKE